MKLHKSSGKAYYVDSRKQWCWKVPGWVNPKRPVIYGPRDEAQVVGDEFERQCQQRYSCPRAADARALTQVFLDRYATRKHLEPRTRDRYKQLLRHLERIGAIPLGDVSPDDVRIALDAIQGSEARKCYWILFPVFEQAKKDGLIGLNPVTCPVPAHKRKRKQRAYTRTEIHWIKEAAKGDRLEALVWLGFQTARRPGELIGLRKCNVFLAEGAVLFCEALTASSESDHRPVISAMKNDDTARKVYVGLKTLEVLRMRLSLAALTEKVSEFVFTSDKGGPIRHSNLARRWWKRLLDRAAVLAEDAARKAGDPSYEFPRLGLYALRQTGVEVNRAVVDSDVEADRAGHDAATALRHYRGVDEDRHREAAQQIEDWFVNL